MKINECIYKSKCGGCQYQGMPYSETLLIKQKYVNKCLEKYCTVENIIGMDNPYHYRCKVHFAFGCNKSGIVSGIYQPSSHKIVPVERCLIDNESADIIISSIQHLMQSFKLTAFDERKMSGLIKHIMVRIGLNSNEIMVIIVTSSFNFPYNKDFIKELLKIHPEITTVVQNINMNHTNMVLGEKNITLYGKGYIKDYCLGYSFKISPNSFYQVNPIMMEKVYSKAIALQNLSGKEIVLDAYCGTGTIGLIISKYVKKVYGVELNRNAYYDAILNAKYNKIENIEFINADSAIFLSSNIKSKKFDIIIMDPPRSGCSTQFLKSVLFYNPKNIVYISCNPETLARDISILSSKYSVSSATPFDMFPFTEHVETVVLMSHN